MCDLAKLQELFERNILGLSFIPFFDFVSERMAAVEAKVRQYNNQSTANEEVVFNEIEKNDLIGILDIWLLNEVFSLQKKCVESGQQFCPILVNISVSTLCNPYNIYDMMIVFKQYNLPVQAVQIALNFTNNQFDSYGLQKGFSYLKQNGIKIMLNDFRPESDTLPQLKNYDFDIIKLDPLFVKQATKSKQTEIDLRRILDLSQELHITSVCGGIDTPIEHHFLNNLVCGWVQGEFYSKPLDQTTFCKMKKCG